MAVYIIYSAFHFLSWVKMNSINWPVLNVHGEVFIAQMVEHCSTSVDPAVSAGFAPWRVRPHRVRPHIDSSSDQVLQIYRSHTEKKDNIVHMMKQNMFISRSLSH